MHLLHGFVCVHVHVHVCMQAWVGVCMHVHVCVQAWVWMCACMCACMHVRMHEYVCVQACVCACMCICACKRGCGCACMAACVCVCNAFINYFLFKSAVAQCTPLPESANAIATYTAALNPNYPTGTVAIFICTSGYELIEGSLYRVCSNGIWSGTPAVCFCELYNCKSP